MSVWSVLFILGILPVRCGYEYHRLHYLFIFIFQLNSPFGKCIHNINHVLVPGHFLFYYSALFFLGQDFW